MAMPSVTVMVQNSRGVPFAAATRPASPLAPGASARCCRARPRSSRWRRRRRAGGSARATDPSRNNRSDAGRGRAPRSHAGSAAASYRTSSRPSANAQMRCEGRNMALAPPLPNGSAQLSCGCPPKRSRGKSSRPMLLLQAPISQSFMAQTRHKCLSLLQFSYSCKDSG